MVCKTKKNMALTWIDSTFYIKTTKPYLISYLQQVVLKINVPVWRPFHQNSFLQKKLKELISLQKCSFIRSFDLVTSAP